MKRRSKPLVITDMDDGRRHKTTVASFCRANREDLGENLCTRARGLKSGKSFMAGGGAAPLVRISRPKR